MKMRLSGWCAMAALALALPASASFAQNRIGFVSQERIMRESAAAQRAQKKFEADFSKRQQELSKLGEHLRKLQENLERNAMTMSESERAKREREFNEANRELQRKDREFREDVNAFRNEQGSVILNRATQIVRKIAESEKLDVVLQEGQVVWFSPRIDITDKVIKALDDPKAAK